MTDDPAFSYKRLPPPNAFIQWKGTDVCMDFRCKCGAHCHFDGGFAYFVKCPHCDRVYEMPFNVFPREVEKDPNGNAKMLQPDEDHSDEVVVDGCLEYAPRKIAVTP